MIINTGEYNYGTRSIKETEVGTNPPITIKYKETSYWNHPRGETPLPWHRVSSLSKEVSIRPASVHVQNYFQSKNFLMESLVNYNPGSMTERKAVFVKMTAEAKRYKEPDQLLQAKVVINMYFEVKANEFAATTKAMVKLLKMYPTQYTAPPGRESQRRAALKVANLLCNTVKEETFAAILARAAALSLNVVSNRKVQQPEEAIDLSDEDEVPLSTNTKFTTHRSILLEEKDGLLSHMPASERLEKLINERTFVREWGEEADGNKAVAARVVNAYAKKDVSACDAEKTQQYLLKAISHRIKILQKECETKPKSGGEQRTPEKSGMATTEESALAPSDVEELKYHSSGALMPPPPESGLGKDHPYASKVVNTSEVQLLQPRVPHPVSNEHAMSCMTIVNEIEQMQESKDYNISTNIIAKLTLWLCPPGFSWALTFNTTDKRKQAFKLAKEATEILNMRVRREAVSRDMAQRKMDASAEGTFPYFKYDIEREFQLMKKFRRELFHTELGPAAALELDNIKRLESASANTGMSTSEKLLFKKLMKAKLQAIADAAAEAQTKKSKTPVKQRRLKCQYCKKRHPGGPSKCRKRKADERANAAAALTTATVPAGAATGGEAPPAQPQKRNKGITIARDTQKQPKKP